VEIGASGFADAAARVDHFEKHGADFGAKSAHEYEQMARDFLNQPPKPTIVRGVRRGNGDILRYDTESCAFAVMRSDGVIKTFFKPNPNWHGFRSNLAYFQAECAK
jgi:filamentous hemagglutinin